MFSFATGTSSFEKIRKDANKPLYLDKTDLLFQIFSSSSEALLFTRPIRFMKSTNLNMIASFCDIQKGEENTILFEGLSIRNFSQPGREAIWNRHFGQYPVIFLSFANITPGDGEHISKQFKDIISDLYEKHEYLLNSSLSDRKKKIISNILDKTADLETFQKSLKFLSECLNVHYNRPAVILIDEYDTPLHHAQIYDETHDTLYVQEDFTTHERSAFKQTLDFMLAFLKPGLKDNAHLHKGIMTGVLRTAFGSLVSTLNNVDVFSMLDQSSRYAPYFGVTENDIEYLLTVLKIEEKIAVREKLRAAYNGYTIAGVILYNPWSIMSYFSKYVENYPNGQPTEAISYWLGTGNSGIIGVYLRKFFPQLSQDLNALLNLQPLRVTLNERSTFSDSGSGDLAAFWGMLLQSGYLTKINTIGYTGDEIDCNLRIPNNEVYGAFILHLRHMFVSERKTQLVNNRFTDALLEEKFDDFANYLKEYLIQVVSYFDIQKTSGAEAHLIKRRKRGAGVQKAVEKTGDEFIILPEIIFHVLVMGVIAGLHQAQYLVHSNRESGEGRYDLLLLPCKAKHPGIIFEFKKTDSADELEDASNAALKQIEDKNYKTTLEAYGVTRGIHIGIAFFGKELCLKYNEVIYQPTVSFRMREPISDYFSRQKEISAASASLQYSSSVFNISSAFYKLNVNSTSNLLEKIYDVLDFWSWEIEDRDFVAAKKASLESFYKENASQINQTTQFFGLALVRITGDGNCFFRAVFDQLYQRYPNLIAQIKKITQLSQVDHATLRQLAVGALIARIKLPDYPTGLKQNLNQLARDQRHNGRWAEDEIIRMMANVLDITIVLVNSEGDNPLTVIMEGQRGIIYLAYHRETHFDSLLGEPSHSLLNDVTTQINRSAQNSHISLETAWNNITQNQPAAKFVGKLN